MEVYYYSNGKVSVECTKLNGVYHGSFRRWYFSGQLEFEVNYWHGQWHGEALQYHPNGQLESRGRYLYDLPVGNHVYWNDQSICIRRKRHRVPMSMRIKTNIVMSS